MNSVEGTTRVDSETLVIGVHTSTCVYIFIYRLTVFTQEERQVLPRELFPKEWLYSISVCTRTRILEGLCPKLVCRQGNF